MSRKTNKNTNIFSRQHDALKTRKEKRFDICFFLHTGEVVSFSTITTGYGEDEAKALQEARVFIGRRLYGDLSYKYRSQTVSKVRVYDRTIKTQTQTVQVDDEGEVIPYHYEKHRHADAIVIAYPDRGESLSPCGKFIHSADGSKKEAKPFQVQPAYAAPAHITVQSPKAAQNPELDFLFSFWTERVKPNVGIDLTGVFPVKFYPHEGGFKIEISKLFSDIDAETIISELNKKAETFSTKKIIFKWQQ